MSIFPRTAAICSMLLAGVAGGAAGGGAAEPIQPGDPWPVFEPPTPDSGEPGASIVEITQHPASGVWSVWLDNGVLIHHRAMDRGSGLIAIGLTIPHLDLGGRGLSGSELAVAEAAAAVLNVPATEELDADAMRALLRGRRVTIRASATADATTIRVDTRVEDAALAIELLGELLGSARIHDEALGRWQTGSAARLDAVDRAPPARARREIARSLSPDSVVTREDLAAVSPERVQAWLDALGARPMEAAICGDLDRVPALTMMADSLARLPDRERIVPMHAEAGSRPLGAQADATLEGARPQAVAMWALLLDEPLRASGRRRLTIGMDALQQRLESALQHERQLAFSVGAQVLVPGDEAGAGGLLLAVLSEPARIDESIELAERELTAIAEEGVGAPWLDKARERQLAAASELRGSARVWANYLSTRQWWSREIDDLLLVVERLEAEPADAIDAQLQDLLASERRVRARVVGVPEEAPATGRDRPSLIGPGER